MSEKNVNVCDKCGKLTDHPESTAGWISISGDIRCIERFTGVKYGGHWDVQKSVDSVNDPDFCSFKCLLEWFKIKCNVSPEEEFDN
jgi:hypothetical protein